MLLQDSSLIGIDWNSSADLKVDPNSSAGLGGEETSEGLLSGEATVFQQTRYNCVNIYDSW